MLLIERTKIEYEQDPMGISRDPRFTWILKSSRQNVRQERFHVQISEDEAFCTLVLDEERVSGESANVRFGLELKDFTVYYFRVCCTDDSKESSGWSEVNTFTTSFYRNARFTARFITVETEEDRNDSKGTYLRKEIRITKPVRSAFAAVTAKGLYSFHIDGAKIGRDELSPGWTSYHHRLLYQTYDVTKELEVPGTHCLGAHLCAGWYKGRMGFAKGVERNLYGEKTAFLCEIHIRYEDGTEETVVTDDSWEGHASPVVFSEIYDGEVYDARLRIPCWACPGGVSEKWTSVFSFPADNSVLQSGPYCPVRRIRELPAKRIFRTPEGDTVIDFGQNMAGQIRIELPDSHEGDVIELDCFETLDAKGNVYTENLRTAKNRIVYLCGGGPVRYTPHFTYQGFRYAKIASFIDGMTPEKGHFTAFALHSDMEETGAFDCSDPDLNALWHNITWGMRSNFVDIPTDCPQRDERMGWTGDAQIFCRTAAFLMQTETFFEKWLEDVSADQGPDGAVSHVVPDPYTVRYSPDAESGFIRNGSQGAAAWGDVIVLNPWNLYLAYGDRRILEDRYDSMKKWIGFMKAHADGCVWTYKTQFGDWVALDAEPGSYHGATPDTFTSAAYYAYVTGVMAKIASVLGKGEDKNRFASLHEALRKDFGRRFFDENTGGMTIPTQTAHVLAIRFGLVPGPFAEGTVRELLKLLAERNGHLATGFVGTPYICFALSSSGHLKEAYELLLKDDYPSWLYQVKKGATTVWEHWDGLKPDGTMWSPAMNSFNHYAYGAVGDWMAQVISGIRQDEKAPGYRHAILYPQPGGGLTYAKGTLETEYGTLSCSWKKTKDGYEISVRIPANASAQLKFDTPDGLFEKELGSGQYDFMFPEAD
ncbi:MAG: family 78 glycoside hydrolase catalytic domain [Lachnospiraceae bacterium]|nr:family 78 glycoside hydrolase catalytic domain [Lachnospiraceae bacterium]